MNNIRIKIIKKFRILFLWIKLFDLGLAKTLIQKDACLSNFNPKTKKIRVGHSFLDITADNIVLIIDSFQMMQQLSCRLGFKWKNSGNKFLQADFGQQTISIESLEEIFILTEVYLNNSYLINMKGPCHVIDIGANVGISCMYFASQEWVQSISAYEPLTPTFLKANENLAMNPSVNSKIQLFNFGLSDACKQVGVHYSREWKGSVGISTRSDSVERAPDLICEAISLKKSSEIFKNIILDHKGLPLVVKMDCEGSEYDILPELASAGIIQNVSAFLIEWHDGGSKVLEDILIENGFITRKEPLYSGRDLGMLYAFKIS
jgi:FkbM family methyltransferase